MNTDILKGEWNELKGKAQAAWGKLTGDELDLIQGEATRLEGLLRQKYGYSKAKAKKEITQFVLGYDQLSIKEEWVEFKEKVKEKWGELTDNDLDEINGSRTKLTAKLQEIHNENKAKLSKNIDDFLSKFSS